MKVTHWKVDAPNLLHEATKIAMASRGRNIATAASDVMNAMATDGVVDPETSAVYAMVMKELFASGAFRAKDSIED